MAMLKHLNRNVGKKGVYTTVSMSVVWQWVEMSSYQFPFQIISQQHFNNLQRQTTSVWICFNSPCGHFFSCVLHRGQRVPPVTDRLSLLIASTSSSHTVPMQLVWLTVCIWKRALWWKPVFFCILDLCNPAQNRDQARQINSKYFAR